MTKNYTLHVLNATIKVAVTKSNGNTVVTLDSNLKQKLFPNGINKINELQTYAAIQTIETIIKSHAKYLNINQPEYIQGIEDGILYAQMN